MINLSKWKNEIPKNTIAIEISGIKKNAQKNYNDGLFNCWTPKRIKEAFAFGRGTIKDLKQYAKNNQIYYTFIFF